MPVGFGAYPLETTSGTVLCLVKLLSMGKAKGGIQILCTLDNAKLVNVNAYITLEKQSKALNKHECGMGVYFYLYCLTLLTQSYILPVLFPLLHLPNK